MERTWEYLRAIHNGGSQLLREMENCNMEDPMESPKVWLYKLNSINHRMGEIDASYRKMDI